ncbi:LCI family antimicrobial peptide [Bacillus anthracis]|uniref:LCI family antimicrobial peptide n=1 Tax=Bacillus anthracis TaxID=1392 RepID=UPI003D2095D5
MFKKLVVGALATDIALTGGIGAASASTEGVENTKKTAPSIAELGNTTYYYNSDYDFWYTHDSNRDVYKTYEFYSSDGYFVNYFEDTNKRIKWYFKGVVGGAPGGGKYGHYEGRQY